MPLLYMIHHFCSSPPMSQNIDFETLNQFNLNTNEVAVGRWINGKTIYRKTLIGTTDASGNAKIPFGSTAIEYLVHAFGAIYSSDSQLWPFPFYNSNTKHCAVYLNISSKNVELVGSSYLNNQQFILTLYYTKTTG